MRLLKPNFEIVKQDHGVEGIYRQIEKAGRVCYKSEDKMTKESSRGFVDRMINSGHMSVLEHGTVYLRLPLDNMWYVRFDVNPHSVVKIDHDTDELCVTTNLRVLIENEWEDLIDKYLVEPSSSHEKRICVKFTTQIAISREFNRHRVNSISESSTRYCNYSKDKFGNEISVNLPTWIEDDGNFNADFDVMCHEIANDEYEEWNALDWWWFSNIFCEKAYMELIKLGWQPQQARVVLPIDTNTEIVHTAFVSDWKHFFDLRADGTTGAPHPDAKVIAEPLKKKFIELGLL